MEGETKRTLIPSRDVFRWPEFKALAARLGIPELPHETGVTIVLDCSEAAKFELRAFCTKERE